MTCVAVYFSFELVQTVGYVKAFFYGQFPKLLTPQQSMVTITRS